ncbi:MAG: hypothetical protein PHQ20_02445 [Candidatus Moranbacteria bacterium]|jgi:hypothetical protein|nr:hypothetical protein [Candidatus Moranbacteria bacterium]
MGRRDEFSIGQPVRTVWGAIITPIFRKNKFKEETRFIEFVYESRWEKCCHQEQCVDFIFEAKIDCAGFSCLACPLKDSPQHIMSQSDEEKFIENMRCYLLLKAIFPEAKMKRGF